MASTSGRQDILKKLAADGKGKHGKKNACRCLHRLVEGAGVTLKLQMEAVSVVVRRTKPLGTSRVWWPVITMQEWASHLLINYPKILLGGHTFDESHVWEPMFSTFWRNYESIDGTHPVFSGGQNGHNLANCIPYCFHGDEGRGKGRDPFLVVSFQPVISHLGMKTTNESTHLVRM